MLSLNIDVAEVGEEVALLEIWYTLINLEIFIWNK